MPYGEQTIKELQQSADITPMGIQLEVNAEIFRVIYNIIWNTHDSYDIDFSDMNHLETLWRSTVHEIARIETRKGYYIPMEQQIDMLREAYAIERKYSTDQIFHSHVPFKLKKETIQEESRFSDQELQALFDAKVWPSLCRNKHGGQNNPMAFIVAGQPGSGKSRISSLLLKDWNGDIVQATGSNFRGFHPHYRELSQKYKQYTPFFTLREGSQFSEITLTKSINERYNVLYECSLIHIDPVLDLITRLKQNGYTVWILLRACPAKESWKAIHQLFLQQRLKAPGLTRMISREYHDKACLSFLSSTEKLVQQNAMDRLIVKSPKGLLYDSDDLPTERVIDILTGRMQGE